MSPVSGSDGAEATPDGTDAAKTSPTSKAGSRPSPAASAASRARRIGGPVSRPPASKTTPRKDDEASAAKVSMAKPATAEPETAKALKEKAEQKPQRPPRRPLPGWAVWTPPVVFLVIAAVFIALIVAERSGDAASAPTPKQRDVVLAATKNCVAATNTYRYTNVDKYEKAGLKCATGVYARQYRNAMETLIKKNAASQKFTQLAQVNTAGVEAVTDGGKQWTILVFGQLNITNTATGKNGRVDPFALVATMQRVNGAWVIAAIKLLATPTG